MLALVQLVSLKLQHCQMPSLGLDFVFELKQSTRFRFHFITCGRGLENAITAKTLLDLPYQLRGRRQIQRALCLFEGFPNRSYGLVTDAIDILYVLFKSLGTPCQTTKGFAGFEMNEIEKKSDKNRRMKADAPQRRRYCDSRAIS